MIEVLVALLVLSFGTLGMVGLHAASLQLNRDSRLQATAVRLAAELAERMRGNKVVATASTSIANPYLQTDFRGAVPALPGNCAVASCPTPLDVANWDVYEWLARVREALPDPRVVVCFDAAPFDTNGLPRWACSNAGGVAYVKIGWTRAGTDRSKTGAAAFDRSGADDSRPGVVLPVIAGNSQ